MSADAGREAHRIVEVNAPEYAETLRLARIGAWVEQHLRWHEFSPWGDGYFRDEPYPGACGGCGHPQSLHPWAILNGEARYAGYDHGLNTALAADAPVEPPQGDAL